MDIEQLYSPKEYRITYLSEGAHGKVFKIKNKDKGKKFEIGSNEKAVKIQVLEDGRKSTILIEMAILVEIDKMNKKRRETKQFNPFLCNLEECMIVGNSIYLNDDLSEKLQDNISTISVIETNLADRGTLFDFLKLRNADVRDIIFQLTYCLMDLKRTIGLIHRDIKPSNILLDKNKNKPISIFFDGKEYLVANKYKVSLTDFGLSSTFENFREVYYRNECWKIGTWVWNPPVLALHYNLYLKGNLQTMPIRSYESDIWSLGMVTLSLCMAWIGESTKDNVYSFIYLYRQKKEVKKIYTYIKRSCRLSNTIIDENQIILLICSCILQKALGNEFLPDFNNKTQIGTCHKIIKKFENILDPLVNSAKQSLKRVECIFTIDCIQFIKKCLNWDQSKTIKYAELLSMSFFDKLLVKKET
jgi:serine/threonine protein kinase